MERPTDLQSGKHAAGKQLKSLIDRFAQAWKQTQPSGPEPILTAFLPPPEHALRAPALLELVQLDLEMRWQLGRGCALESYLEKYPELGPAGKLPATLVIAEYRLRHQYADQPPLEFYQKRFPRQFAELKQWVDQQASPTDEAVVATSAQEPVVVAAPLATTQRELVPIGGGYRLLKRIGAGSFGEVWSAEAPGGVAAAVKIITRPLDHQEAQRELQSLELIKGLRHPFLLQTQAYASLEDRLMIVMELADGSLQDRLKQCRQQGLPGIPLPELLTIFREACEALDFLHAHHVQHRDIKPANILLLQGHAKVADFGLARLQEGRQSVTATSSGTPTYMAPEIWRGKVNPSSDQYSLAITYAELRLNRRLFTGKDMIALMYQHMQETPDLSPLPEAEQRVIHRAIAKQPEDRYPSCLDFMRELEQTHLPQAPSSSDPFASSARGSAILKPAPSITDPIIALSLSIQGEAPRRRRFVKWCGALLAVGVVAVVAWAVLRPGPDRNVAATTATAPAEVDWLPPGIEKGDGAEVQVVDGKRFYNRIVKVQADRRIAFRLIPRQAESDPQTFYMMENKVDNDLFIRASQEAAFQTLLERHQKAHPWTVKGEWKLGGLAAGNDVGISNGQLPVLRVTVTEAYCLARWLGGNLPTAQQWDKAGGRFNGDAGPFQPPEEPGQIAVGLGKTGPLPVDRKLCEASRFGCRDMAGNGSEWTRNLSLESSRNVPVDDPQPEMLVVLRGRNYAQPKPLLFADLNRGGESRGYGEASPFIGFRVVLELNLVH